MSEMDQNPPAEPERRARVTLRCLTEDLQVDIPPIDRSIEDLDDAHPAIKKAYELAPSFPLNQEPIESLRDVHVFKFPLANSRAATWLDTATNVVWLVGYGLRRADEAYLHFQALHGGGRLLPDERDGLRDLAEGETRFLRAVAHELPDLIERAIQNPGEEVAESLAGSLEVRIYLADSSEPLEMWFAVSKRSVDGAWISEQRTLAVFVQFEEAVGAELSEEVDPAEWPTMPLAWFVATRLYVA
jgi:hypothetical protein